MNFQALQQSLRKCKRMIREMAPDKDADAKVVRQARRALRHQIESVNVAAMNGHSDVALILFGGVLVSLEAWNAFTVDEIIAEAGRVGQPSPDTIKPSKLFAQPFGCSRCRNELLVGLNSAVVPDIPYARYDPPGINLAVQDRLYARGMRCRGDVRHVHYSTEDHSLVIRFQPIWIEPGDEADENAALALSLFREAGWLFEKTQFKAWQAAWPQHRDGLCAEGEDDDGEG